jgi:hypothetical protein
VASMTRFISRFGAVRQRGKKKGKRCRVGVPVREWAGPGPRGTTGKVGRLGRRVAGHRGRLLGLLDRLGFS